MSTLQSVEELAERIESALAYKTSSARLLVAIAGAPGSGKSTLAQQLRIHLNRNSPAGLLPSVVVPMDGFHLDNAILQSRNQMAVKGAPQTFDVGGFHSLLTRLAEPVLRQGERGHDHSTIYVPVFDRSVDLARNAAQAVESDHRIILVEGNYLLLSQQPWSVLKPLFDMSITLDVPLNILKQRLEQRWLDHGHTAEQARQRAASNDLPNASLVIEHSVRADLYYESVRQ